jgi:hypothetical protein
MKLFPKLLIVAVLSLASAVHAQNTPTYRNSWDAPSAMPDSEKIKGIKLRDVPADVLLLPGSEQSLGILETFMSPLPKLSDGLTSVVAVATVWKLDCVHTSLIRLMPDGYFFSPREGVGLNRAHELRRHDPVTDVDQSILTATINQVCANPKQRKLLAFN